MRPRMSLLSGFVVALVGASFLLAPRLAVRADALALATATAPATVTPVASPVASPLIPPPMLPYASPGVPPTPEAPQVVPWLTADQFAAQMRDLQGRLKYPLCCRRSISTTT